LSDNPLGIINLIGANIRDPLQFFLPEKHYYNRWRRSGKEHYCTIKNMHVKGCFSQWWCVWMLHCLLL